MPRYTRIPIRGIVVRLPDARAWFPSGKSHGNPVAIWVQGMLYRRIDLTDEQWEQMCDRFGDSAARHDEEPPARSKRGFQRGELKRELEEIIKHEVPLVDGETVPKKTFRKILAVLRRRDPDVEVKSESVRSKLRRMGYSAEQPPGVRNPDRSERSRS